MGGTTASYAMLGDIIIAEPNALIGFAGQRVIKQTIGEDLPEGFQRAEFLKKHGFIDEIVSRDKMKGTLFNLIEFFKKKDAKFTKYSKKIIQPTSEEKQLHDKFLKNELKKNFF